MADKDSAGSPGSQGPHAPKPGASAALPEKSWLRRQCLLLLRRDRQAQKAGQLFSGLLALNLVFLGGAFICSMIFNHQAVTLGDVWILLAVLKVLSLLWLLYYLGGTARRPQAIPQRDPHAGPLWVRGSLVLFGVCSAILNLFRIGYDVGHVHCKSQVELVFPILEVVFIGVQTYVLWGHCKDCVQVQTNFTRCGLMLTLATNLLLWALAVTNDSLHREMEAELDALMEKFTGNGTNTCLCPNASVCEFFQEGYLMLYPFSTEYSLITCRGALVMWKNVGRRPRTCPGPRPPAFRLHGAIFGPLLGLLALLAGVCVFVTFQIEASGPPIAGQYFTLYYAYYVSVLPAMALAALLGTAIHGLEERELDTVKNPTRSLDVVLLMGAALGPVAISTLHRGPSAATRPPAAVHGLILAYSVCCRPAPHQNLFIIEGAAPPPPSGSGPGPPAGKEEGERERPGGPHAPRRDSVARAGASLRRASLAYIHSYSHLNWKRRALKEISLFLVLCNVTLWIMPAFGAHPEFENGLEKDFYGYRTWFTIVNFGCPLSVFYRMHSVGGLVEVYLGA
ncbi:LOW QUALITY PROTEIN: proton channel OTOP3 [Ornithorhynchus anatinus]|uniref:LOW QUALITY PROTEIN: proton channel OTOP3 n=1 Tax=Ornithorhynchus anatinus TaxID=9258 RepID=UPI0010A8FDFF|nr:LOW QUALITY PROTEIN: proton channel OTOP3 [Ornithorhynchus anatinus]